MQFEIMKNIELPFIEIIGIASTRGMLGAGIGLLVGEKLSRHDRRLLGTILLTIGIVSTAPLVYDVLRRRRLSAS